MKSSPPSILLLGCGAIAWELRELQQRNDWAHIKLQCLPAGLHNTPEKIPDAVGLLVERWQRQYDQILVAYADCGTGGLLDAKLDEYGLERLPGAHCYEFFSGPEVFDGLCTEEIGTYYLTDFLVRHFDRLIKTGLGLDAHPELLPAYFSNYKRVMYLAQTHSENLSILAREHANYLGLEYSEHYTGLEPLGRALAAAPILVQS